MTQQSGIKQAKCLCGSSQPHPKKESKREHLKQPGMSQGGQASHTRADDRATGNEEQQSMHPCSLVALDLQTPNPTATVLLQTLWPSCSARLQARAGLSLPSLSQSHLTFRAPACHRDPHGRDPWHLPPSPCSTWVLCSAGALPGHQVGLLVPVPTPPSQPPPGPLHSAPLWACSLVRCGLLCREGLGRDVESPLDGIPYFVRYKKHSVLTSLKILTKWALKWPSDPRRLPASDRHVFKITAKINFVQIKQTECKIWEGSFWCRNRC